MDLADIVKKTIAYGEYFRFPLTPVEVHKWLIYSKPISYSSIKKYLPNQTEKARKYRESLKQNTTIKEKLADKFVSIARHIPFIQLIAITGSVAANNSKDNDDLDLMIITKANTLWIVRPLLLIILTVGFKRRLPGSDPDKTKNYFCPNLWLDDTALAIPQKRRNLYTAHEVLQIKPLFDVNQTYQRFIKSNKWTSTYLANAYKAIQSSVSANTKTTPSFFWIPLNLTLFFVQYLYMIPKITTESISLHSAYFHKNDISKQLEKHIKNKSL